MPRGGTPISPPELSNPAGSGRSTAGRFTALPGLLVKLIDKPKSFNSHD